MINFNLFPYKVPLSEIFVKETVVPMKATFFPRIMVLFATFLTRYHMENCSAVNASWAGVCKEYHVYLTSLIVWIIFLGPKLLE